MIGKVVYRSVGLDLFTFSLAAYLTADHFPNLVLAVAMLRTHLNKENFDSTPIKGLVQFVKMTAGVDRSVWQTTARRQSLEQSFSMSTEGNYIDAMTSEAEVSDLDD